MAHQKVLTPFLAKHGPQGVFASSCLYSSLNGFRKSRKEVHMAYLDRSLNQKAKWQEILRLNHRRIEVDLEEVERVLDLARRTPGLSTYEKELHQLSVFFAVATHHYREEAPDELSGLVAFWERYRAVVIQRYTGITPVELRAADKVVHNTFDRFLKAVPNERIAYAPDARPLVYGGEGGLGAYFTHPPGWNRPFAIINLPHAAFDNVWQWLALPHETGHDLYATVDGLPEELNKVLGDRMRKAVSDGEVRIPHIRVDLRPHGIPHVIDYTPEDFLATLWRGWANEAQADMVGLLNCGGATAVALQQIIGFSAEDRWDLRTESDGTIADGPESHPTSYVRNALNIAALRRIGGGHSQLADQIEERFRALRPAAPKIVWRLGRVVEVAQINTDEMIKSAQLAAVELIDYCYEVLGGKSYAELATFTADDQAKVDALVDPLLRGDPTFAQGDGVEPRHALAATIFAFERDRQRANVINSTFKHFV